MCKKCLIAFLLFLFLVGFGFLVIAKNAKAAVSGPVINEVAWMGSTTSANNEWIELYNPSDESIVLTGWKLDAADGSPSVALTGEIPSGGYFLLERTNDWSVPNIKANQIYAGSLDNKGEDLKLIDANGAVRDEINAVNGWPAGDNATKATLARDYANLAIVRWGNGPVNGTPLAKNILVSVPSEKPEAPLESAPLAKKTTSTKKQTHAMGSGQTSAPTQTQDNQSNSASLKAANIAAFNARVQQTAQQNSSPLAGAKELAGAFALLGIGALAAYTIIKRRQRDAREE